ncbi:MAG: hypothetical protein ACT4NX_05610 [Deltaproteobacteria bacterium]
MADIRKDIKVEDVTEFFKDLSGLVKENYLLTLDAYLSVWEENQKFANAQLEQFYSFQREYAEQVKTNFEKLPKQVSEVYTNSGVDRIAAAQKEYVNLVKSVSDKFTKSSLALSQKLAEKAFSAFDEQLKTLKY